MTPAPTPPYRQCKKRFWRGFTLRSCLRMARKEGYCTQHHPDYVAPKKPTQRSS